MPPFCPHRGCGDRIKSVCASFLGMIFQRSTVVHSRDYGGPRAKKHQENEDFLIHPKKHGTTEEERVWLHMVVHEHKRSFSEGGR